MELQQLQEAQEEHDRKFHKEFHTFGRQIKDLSFALGGFGWFEAVSSKVASVLLVRRL